MKNIRQLGQVFTPPSVTRHMLALRKNRGRVLEPSAGDGAFLRELEDGAVGVEIDRRYAERCGALCMDFFDYPVSEKFDTIIGNPPYVRHQDIAGTTKAKLDFSLFDRRSNLCLFFVAKCLQHLRQGGELIFITPRDFLKATAAIKLNKMLCDVGTITDFIDLGDAKIFADATPNCAIWRFVKGDFSRLANDGKKFVLQNGQIAFVRGDYPIPFKDLFFVKVGAVSGMDSVFTDSTHGNRDFVCSRTGATGKTRRMIYNLKHSCLRPHKEALLSRRIRRFDDSNWWEWGRAHYQSDLPRIYVNAKTRRTHPFFLHPANDYDGSVLAVFPRHPDPDLPTIRDDLNKMKWAELGFVCDGRFLFGQRSLENCMLPKNFKRHLPPRSADASVPVVRRSHRTPRFSQPAARQPTLYP